MESERKAPQLCGGSVEIQRKKIYNQKGEIRWNLFKVFSKKTFNLRSFIPGMNSHLFRSKRKDKTRMLSTSRTISGQIILLTRKRRSHGQVKDGMKREAADLKSII